MRLALHAALSALQGAGLIRVRAPDRVQAELEQQAPPSSAAAATPSSTPSARAPGLPPSCTRERLLLVTP